MTEEETPKIETAVTEDKPQVSVLEETKELIAQLKKEREEVTKIRDELSQLRSDQLLSGTAPGEVKTAPKEENPKEYNDRINKEISEGKHNE